MTRRANHHNELLQLPTEIWIIILRWATWVPFSLNTELRDDFAYPPIPTQQDIQQDLLQVLRTKNFLTRVCKSWNIITTPYLYECVLIRSFRSFVSLSQALSSSRMKKSDRLAVYALGPLIKRVDIMLNSNSTQEYLDAQTLDFDWVSTHDLLPNVQIFVSRGTSLIVGSTTYLFLLLSRSLPVCHLRIVDITRILDNRQASLLGDLLSRTANLKQLRCVYDGILTECIPLEVRSRIQLWCVDYDDWTEADGETFFRMQSLRHFVCLHPPFHDDFCNVLPTIGSSLQTLEFDYSHYGESDDSHQSLLDETRLMCPHLRSLIVVLIHPEALEPRKWDVLPPITYFGLRFTKKTRMLSRSVVNAMYSNLVEIVIKPGTIKVIRILDRCAARLLRKSHLPPMRRMNARLEKHGIRLEGPDGELLV